MRVAIGVPPLWCSLPDMRPTDAIALLIHGITRAGTAGDHKGPPFPASTTLAHVLDKSALYGKGFTRAGLLRLLRLWYGGPSDRENPAIFYNFPSMRDARRPDDVVSLACEEMFFLREDDLSASLE